jgi:hypothetical protein
MLDERQERKSPEQPVDKVDRRWMRRQSTQETLSVSCGRLRGKRSWMTFFTDS